MIAISSSSLTKALSGPTYREAQAAEKKVVSMGRG